jgi:hypothetical protein
MKFPVVGISAMHDWRISLSAVPARPGRAEGAKGLDGFTPNGVLS